MDNIVIRKTKINNEVLGIKLVDLMCKHVLSTKSEKACSTLRYANDECRYEYCSWGSHDGHAGDEEYHIRHIHKMETDKFEMPIRIVKCKYEFSSNTYYWADNLHSTIREIRKNGIETKLIDTRFYIVDISDMYDIKLSSYKRSLRENLGDICNIVECAYCRYKWSNSNNLVSTGYTVGDFVNDNPRLYTSMNEYIV